MSQPPRERVLLEPLPGKCVETVARERYWRGVDRLMRTLAQDEAPEGLEEEVETLRTFLETADVAAVRRETEDIMEAGHGARVLLSRDPHGRLMMRVEAVSS